MSPKLQKSMEEGKTIIGGCCIGFDDPTWECSKCKQQIWKPIPKEELAELYPHLLPDEKNELEVWHRGWMHKMMCGQATQEEYDAAIPPHPDPNHPNKEEEAE